MGGITKPDADSPLFPVLFVVRVQYQTCMRIKRERGVQSTTSSSTFPPLPPLSAAEASPSDQCLLLLRAQILGSIGYSQSPCQRTRARFRPTETRPAKPKSR
ncbi:hypothetical protein ElyMa_004823100 [Elysia marginata]|uniref:Uncharacterized protein n=1 Tax=Elysia marginata TaxID=1093978 RepID=A0AAV4IM94_9GAST|nr:hypothetical protein ElyMa_004823100 [Elysia marginata]